MIITNQAAMAFRVINPDRLFLAVDLGQLCDSLLEQLRRFGQP
jgi:hypothetical protein